MIGRPAARLDHLVVTAASLENGVEWVEAILGVPLQAGGAHPRMGTHNALLRLGESTYLEVLTPDPAAPPPHRPRWFALDSMSPDAAPGLATWAARTADVRRAVEECPSGYGGIEPMSRGPHQWLMTLTPDGSLAGGGAMPFLIEWVSSPHPASTLIDRGCSLSRLELYSPEAGALGVALACVGLERDSVIKVRSAEAVRLVAHIDTPGGTKVLGEQ